MCSTRLIPARAGNTSSACTGAGVSAAHPRSRGEHGCVEGSVRSMGGSSPLARGTRTACAFQDDQPRLIPARAGNTHYYTTTYQW